MEISRAFAATGMSRICIVSRSPGPQAEAKKTLENGFPNVKIDCFLASAADHVAMTEVVEKIGKIDVLALSAAYAAPQRPMVHVNLSDMETSYDTNVIGNWNLVKSVLTKRPNKRCVVLNVSSMASPSLGKAHMDQAKQPSPRLCPSSQMSTRKPKYASFRTTLELSTLPWPVNISRKTCSKAGRT